MIHRPPARSPWRISLERPRGIAPGLPALRRHRLAPRLALPRGRGRCHRRPVRRLPAPLDALVSPRPDRAPAHGRENSMKRSRRAAPGARPIMALMFNTRGIVPAVAVLTPHAALEPRRRARPVGRPLALA